MDLMHHTVTLHCDDPVVSQVVDGVGGCFLAVARNSLAVARGYAVVHVPPQKLRDFRDGLVDLRSLMDVRPGDWCLATQDFCDVEWQGEGLEPSRYLPTDTFRLEPAESSRIAVLDRSKRRKNVVVELKVSPSHDEGVHLNHLYARFQELVAEATKVARRKGMSSTTPTPVEEASRLEAEVTAPGIVLLEAQSPREGRFENEPRTALHWIDGVFHVILGPHAADIHNREAGQLLGSALQLLGLLAEKQLDLQYTWADPESASARQHAITAAQARTLGRLRSCQP